jgi:hypothetical protein
VRNSPLHAGTLGAATSWALALCLICPAPAWAAPANDTSVGESDLAAAEDLYDRGSVSYSNLEYDTAIELWNEAIAKLPEGPESAVIRNTLVYNIARAQIAAYELDGDLVRLKKAKRLLERYVADYEAMFGEEADDAELAKVREQLVEVEELITEAETEPEPEPEPSPEPEPEPESQPSSEPGAQTDGRKLGPLTISGIAVATLGVAGLAVMGAGMGLGEKAETDAAFADSLADETTREDLLYQGASFNTMAIVGGIAGGVLLVTGAVLIGVGVKKDKDRRSAFVPVLDPNTKYGGIAWHGRF